MLLCLLCAVRVSVSILCVCLLVVVLFLCLWWRLVCPDLFLALACLIDCLVGLA